MKDTHITLRELLEIEEQCILLFNSTIEPYESDDILYKSLNSKLVEYITQHNKSIEYTLEYLKGVKHYLSEFFKLIKNKFYNTKFLDMALDAIIANEGRKLYETYNDIEKINILIKSLDYGKAETISEHISED